MGLMSKLSDAAINVATKKETIRLPYEEMANIVERAFISGADDAFLSKVRKTAKGGIAVRKEMKSADDRYVFHVGSRPTGLIWMASKPVWIFDNETNKFYQLDKNGKWKKFFKMVDAKIKMEKINRSR